MQLCSKLDIIVTVIVIKERILASTSGASNPIPHLANSYKMINDHEASFKQNSIDG